MARIPASRRSLPNADLLDRFFWVHFDRSGGVDACHPWRRSCMAHGYGQVSRKDFGGHWYSHVLVYRAVHGDVPEGHFVDHTCHNEDASCAGGVSCRHRPCGNPRHLAAATNQENIDRADSIRKRGRFATHCRNGHEFTEESIGWINRRSGRRAGWRERYCKTCRKN